MVINIQQVAGSKLTSKQKTLINKYRVKEFGKHTQMDFSKEQKTMFFFIFWNRTVVAFGYLKPIQIMHEKKKYAALIMGSGIAIEKGKGYGRLLMAARIAYAKKHGKSVIGFTKRHNFSRFLAYGMKGKRCFTHRFRYAVPKTEILSKYSVEDVIYLNGKDNFFARLFKTKSIAITNSDFR